MKKIILSLLLTFSSVFAETRIKVAIIDTGIGVKQKYADYSCQKDHKSFVDSNIYDYHGHGTNIISIISKSINPKTHCIVSYKVWKDKVPDQKIMNATVNALKSIVKDISIKYVNISMGGPSPHSLERKLIEKLLIRGVIISVAAGNGDDEGNGYDLDKKCVFYPACYRQTLKYSNFNVVSTFTLRSSNQGKIVTDKFSGYRVGTPVMSGTSQATAQKTAQILKSMVYNNRRTKGDRLQSSSTNYRRRRYNR